MFGWIKNIFRKKEPLVLTDPIKYEDEVKIQERPAKPAPTKPNKSVKKQKKAAKKSSTKKYTKEDLEKMDKLAIDRLADNELDLKLDRRKKKETMIEEFLAAQK